MIYTNLSDENRAFLATPRPNYPGVVTARAAYMNDDEAERYAHLDADTESPKPIAAYRKSKEPQ